MLTKAVFMCDMNIQHHYSSLQYHSNMVIWCPRNIYFNYLCCKQLCCL